MQFIIYEWLFCGCGVERVVCVWEYVDRSRAFSSVVRLSIILEFRLGDHSIYLAK